VVEGDAVPLDEALEGVVVRDHAGDLDVEFLRLPARQQVVEAVLLLADTRTTTRFLTAESLIASPSAALRRAAEALAELGEVKGSESALTSMRMK
jgi:hypothetical protein